jgi:hypothetical protein
MPNSSHEAVNMTTLEQVIEKYVAEGYEVLVDPAASQLPDFAAGLSPEIVARKGDEGVIVTVKMNREDVREDPSIVRMAQVVNSQAGWRFDLVVLGADPGADEIPSGASEPSLHRIVGMLDYAATAAGARDLQSSFVIAWAALEAAMRRTARENGISLTSYSPQFLVRTLYSNGLLGRQELDRLSGAITIRNAAAHGMELPKLDVGVCYYVISVAHQLLSGAEHPASTAPVAMSNLSTS